MKRFIFIYVLILPIISFSQPLTFEKTDEGAWIKDHGEKVFFYQAKMKSLDGQTPRANYIHPLFGIDGFELTEDFPKDHLHHRGIFWTWHQVIIGDQPIGDAWECKDFVWDVHELEQVDINEKAVSFNAKIFWKSTLWLDDLGDQKPFLEENTKIIVQAKTENYRIVDFEISLLALEHDLKIGGSDDAKGYSGFSVRMKMPGDIQFTSSIGEVKPTVGPIHAGPWMDVSASLSKSGGKAGIVMMCSQDNPVYPDPWILRKKGSMQNPTFPGRVPVLISEKKPTILRYRLVVYKGELTDVKINELQEEF